MRAAAHACHVCPCVMRALQGGGSGSSPQGYLGLEAEDKAPALKTTKMLG